MYNPFTLRRELAQTEHGKAKISALRKAIREADENHDLIQQLAFRLDLCYESTFYDDAMDMMIIFPEILALVDEHPEIPMPFGNTGYKNGLDRVLCIYKWVLNACGEYYQIPLKDCQRFMEDFKKRSLAFGYNLKPYYKNMFLLYSSIDKAYAEECFAHFKQLPSDKNGDCKACDRNEEIAYYLERDEVEKANELAADIDNFTLQCWGDGVEAWMRMKSYYLEYYLKKKDFDRASDYIRQIEHQTMRTEMTEYEYWDRFLYCYSFTDMGKALKLYKEHWKEWEEQRCPKDKFRSYILVAAFFKQLQKQHGGQTIKLNLDNSFSLYSENGEYEISKLHDYYYSTAKNIALKFDQRNGTDYYADEMSQWYGV